MRIEKPFLAAVALVFTWVWPLPCRAQSPAETRAFTAAMEEYEDGSYTLAEKELGEFIRAFPESAHIPEAILYQAQAALKQQKFKVAVDLLSTNVAVAGPLADQYRYSLAEAYLQSTNYQAAASAFASLSKEFPNSNHLLAASYGEALARFRLKDWSQVIELLQRPDGIFRKEALLRPADKLATRGVLLLAEALLEHSDYGAAEATLRQLSEGDLIPEFKWRRQYLLCRVQMAAHRLPEALASTTNLLALAAAAVERNLLAESVSLQAGILEQLNEFDAAVQVYEKNLAENVPVESARQALLKVTALTLAQNKVPEALQKVELFLAKHPQDAASDVALLTLGELLLRQYLSGVDTNRIEAATNGTLKLTNHLQQALADFERVITNGPQNALIGRAQLDKGWGLWADGKIPQGQAAFQLAAEQLPHSEEQAVARFKLGEAQFFQKDYTNALRNFRSVLGDFSDLPRVKEALFDQALYQVVRASLEVGDVASANEAMRKILQGYPKSFFGDRSMLLVGQHLTSSRKPSDARAVFQELVRRFPNSELGPEIQLAIAHTFEQDKDWRVAITQYEVWLDRFGANALRPRVEFERAAATARAGSETNALALFTNLVARFPDDEMAPRAQFWVGSFYYQQNDFVAAEKNFQDKILTGNTNYAYQALMMAGRAAFGRLAYDQARSAYFERLIQDNGCPEDIKAEAYFALGDTDTRLPSEPGKSLKRFEEAKDAFSKIPALYPTNALVPRAWGRIGDCYLQLATVDNKQYDSATNFYQKVVVSPVADISARSQAETGLGQALEAMAKLSPTSPEMTALLDGAFSHYANVIYEKNLRDGEASDAFWVKTAGLLAVKLAEERNQWEIAMNLYKRLQTKLPPLRGFLEKRVEKIRSEQSR